MKRLLFVAMVCVAFSSCAPVRYFQMYQTQPISDIAMRDNCMVFEDDNCEILYNFWKEHGEIGFVFHNKTSENIYLHLDQCFYVANGMAFDYFRNRVFTDSRSSLTSTQLTYINGSSATNAHLVYTALGGYVTGSQTVYKNGYVYGTTGAISNASSNSISVAEKQIVCIPPKTSKVITEFDIKNTVYRSCDLYMNPGRKDPHSVSFNKSNTPLTFGNKIAYSVGESEDLIRVDNTFYVSKISNYSSQEITKFENIEECGRKKMDQVRVFKEYGPNQFYIEYNLSNMSWKEH